jgi:hypothetical protein
MANVEELFTGKRQQLWPSSGNACANAQIPVFAKQAAPT